jgi:hypothetical protein
VSGSGERGPAGEVGIRAGKEGSIVDLASISETEVDAAHLTVKEIAPGITGRALAEGFEVPECHLFL